MKYKKLHLVYFSPTETGKKNLLAAAAEIKLETVEHNITTEATAINFDNEDLVFFMAPVYSGRIPAVSRERFENFTGNNTDCILFTVYGNRAIDDALKELQSVVENNGFRSVAALSVIGQHTFTDKVANNRPDCKDYETLTSMMKEVSNKLESDTVNHLEVPGNIPDKPASRFAITPKINDNCIHCNKCMEVCPVQAINHEHFNIPDSNLCISCLACVKHCPVNGRAASTLKITPIAKALELSCKKRKEIELFI